jgi:L,D-transpeptidase YcbB
MKKISVIALSALLSVSFVSEALAEHGNAKRKRRVGFFESLFGGFDRPRRQPRVVTQRQQAWWEEDGGDSGGLYGDNKPRRKKKAKLAVATPPAKKKSVAPAVEIDPEVAAGFGMGNLAYVPVKTAPVFDAGMRSLVATETSESAIKVVLTDRATNIRATEDVRKAVLAHYQANGFKPIWTADGNVTARGIAVLDLLSKSADEGLEPLRYKPSAITAYESAVASLDGDTLGLAQFDVGLTVAAVIYAQHQSGGAFEPQALSQYYDVKPERVSAAVALKVLAYSPFPAEYLQDLAPKHPAYGALKAELAKLVEPQETGLQFEDGKRVRIGQKDPRIAALRQRLVKEGFISTADAFVEDDKLIVLDKVLAKALKKFQEDRGIAQTSNLDSATVKALNGPNSNEQRNKLIASMERLRWLPKDLGSRHVFVNQAAQQLAVMDNGRMIWSTNVVVGKPLTQTNAFSDTFDDVVVNPSWTMPQGIFLRDYLPKLRSNSAYTDKKGYKVYDSKGKQISSKSINWNSVGTNSTYRITQPPGNSNSLGNLKFNFPNKHAVYLHDTPQKELFSESVRTFSNGCVRVENPRELAQVLLGLDAEALEAQIDKGATKSIKVPVKTRVHLYYFTAWPDETGKIQYYSDSYGRDSSLTNARALMFKLSGGRPGAQLVQNQVEPAAKVGSEASQ